MTGKLVFEADSALAVIGRHLNADPIPPSVRSGGAVPEALERIILECLAKKPAARPPSATELARSLAAIDLPPWTPEEAQAWWEDSLGRSASGLPVVFPTAGSGRVEGALGRQW